MSPQKRIDVHYSIPVWQPRLADDGLSVIKRWLPSRGNVLFSLLVVVSLIFAQRAKAFGR